MKDRVYSFLGIAMKAGRLVSGEAICEKLLRDGKAFCVIITTDASENTKKKFKNASQYRGVPYTQFGQKETMGKLLGKPKRSVIALTDVGFARRLMELLAEQQGSMKKHGGGLIE